MSDQQEIHIHFGKLEEFLFGADNAARVYAFRAVEGIFGVEGESALEAKAKIIEIFSSNPAQAASILRNSGVADQVTLVGILDRMVELSMRESIQVAIAVMEIAIETPNLYLKKEAEKLLTKYVDFGVNRKQLMQALAAESELSLEWGNAGVFRGLATRSLEYPEAREYALQILMNVASHKQAQLKEREKALEDIETLLLKGADLSCIEMKMRSLAKNRESALCENAKNLLVAAEMRGYNAPDRKVGLFRKIELKLTPVFAPAPLRRTA